MITSMTGFGTAEGVIGTLRLTVEIRAVNHRFFNLTLRLPNSLSRWEGEVREALRKRFNRGHLTVSAWVERAQEGVVAINEERFGAYVQQLRELRDRYSLTGDVDIATVMRLPDVLIGVGAEGENIESADEIVAIVERASDALQAMRQAEGERISQVLSDRLLIVEDALTRLEQRAPERLIEQRNRMQAAVSELAGGIAVDPQRLVQEVAILADRIDVSEELNRFRIHIAAFRNALEASNGEGVGKRLGFLLQEMLRETNTTGSKANDAQMLGDVVLIKEELERLREQVENVE
jgi:uncharacterized protein (TIGR00255 family)